MNPTSNKLSSVLIKRRSLAFLHWFDTASAACLLTLVLFVGRDNSYAAQCDIVVQGTPTILPNPVSPGGTIMVSYVIHNNAAVDASSSTNNILMNTSATVLITAPSSAAPSIASGATSP